MNKKIAIKINYRDYSANLPEDIAKHIANQLNKDSRYKFNKGDAKAFEEIADIVSSAISYFDMLQSKPIVLDPQDLRKNLIEMKNDFNSHYGKLKKDEHKEAVELVVALLTQIINVPDVELMLLTSMNRDEFYPMFVDLFNNMRGVFSFAKIREAQNYTYSYREQVREMLNEEWQRQYQARINFETGVAQTIEDSGKRGRYTPSRDIPRDIRRDLGKVIDRKLDNRNSMVSTDSAINDVLGSLNIPRATPPKEATYDDADKVLSRITREDLHPDDLFVKDENEGKIVGYLGKTAKEIAQEFNEKRRAGALYRNTGRFDYDIQLAIQKFVNRNERGLLGKVLSYPDEESRDQAINDTEDDFVEILKEAYENQVGYDASEKTIDEWKKEYRQFIELHAYVEDEAIQKEVEAEVYSSGVTDEQLEKAEQRVGYVQAKAQSFMRESQSIIQSLNKQLNSFEKMLSLRVSVESSVDDYGKYSLKVRNKTKSYKTIKSTTYRPEDWDDMPLPQNDFNGEREKYLKQMKDAEEEMSRLVKEAEALQQVFDPATVGSTVKPLGMPPVFLPILSADLEYEGSLLGDSRFRRIGENESDSLYDKALRRWSAYRQMFLEYDNYLDSGAADIDELERLESLAKTVLSNLHNFYNASSDVLSTVDMDTREYVDAIGGAQGIEQNSYQELYNDMVDHSKALSNFIHSGNYSNHSTFTLNEDNWDEVDSYLIEDDGEVLTAVAELSIGAEAMQQGIQDTIYKLEEQIDVAKDVVSTKITKQNLLPNNLHENDFLDYMGDSLYDSVFDPTEVLDGYIGSVVGDDVESVALISGKSFILRNLSYKIDNRVKVYA